MPRARTAEMTARLVHGADALAVHGVLDFDSVVQLEVEGRAWLEQIPSPVLIDLTGVTYSSSAGLALLLAWWRAARRLDKRLEITGMPEDMRALARVAGLVELLPLA